MSINDGSVVMWMAPQMDAQGNCHSLLMGGSAKGDISGTANHHYHMQGEAAIKLSLKWDESKMFDGSQGNQPGIGFRNLTIEGQMGANGVVTLLQAMKANPEAIAKATKLWASLKPTVGQDGGFRVFFPTYEVHVAQKMKRVPQGAELV